MLFTNDSLPPLLFCDSLLSWGPGVTVSFLRTAGSGIHAALLNPTWGPFEERMNEAFPRTNTDFPLTRPDNESSLLGRLAVEDPGRNTWLDTVGDFLTIPGLSCCVSDCLCSQRDILSRKGRKKGKALNEQERYDTRPFDYR